MKTEFKVLSSDKIHNLSGVIFLPDGEPKGFFHIVHGMTEHIARYEKIMTDMATLGYICFGFDNLGHGNTANAASELGYIAKENGYDLLAKDVKVFSDAVREKYDPDSNMPYYLMGHSMGSFITRLSITKYVTPDRYIIMGTGGKNPAAGAGLFVISLIKLFYGDRHISTLIDKMAFGSYNKYFGGGTEEDPSPWLTRDEEARKKYYADGFCTFKFTVSAMGDLIKLNKITNEKKWFKNVPKTLPILLLSGDKDPVGDYGKGVKWVAETLKLNGINAKCVLYKDARHEILNDTTYGEVKDEILKFTES